MKVKCVNNREPIEVSAKLTVGKIYKVLEASLFSYKLRDDSNRRRFYDKTRFEIIENGDEE